MSANTFDVEKTFKAMDREARRKPQPLALSETMKLSQQEWVNGLPIATNSR